MCRGYIGYRAAATAHPSLGPARLARPPACSQPARRPSLALDGREERESERSLISQSGPPATVKPPSPPSVPPSARQAKPRAETFFDNLTLLEAPTRAGSPFPLRPHRHHFGAAALRKKEKAQSKKTALFKFQVAKSHC